MRRRIARWFFVLLSGAIATVLGVVSAVLWSPPGLRLVARVVNEQAQSMVRGTVHIKAVHGGWIHGFALDSVVIRDSTGILFAAIPRVQLGYDLRTILGGHLVITSATLHDADIQVIKRRNGRLNYQEIFHLGEGPRSAAPPPLIEIQNLRLDGGGITIRLPWNPDGRLRTRAQIDSALAFERSKPGRRIEQAFEGLELIRTINQLDADIPLLRLSSPDNQPTTVQIQHLAARISDPAIDLRDLKGRIRTKDDSLLFEVEHAELPGTTGSGVGRLDWPRDTILYHFAFDAPRLALADLRWISPKFPDFRGTARVRGKSLSGVRTEYDIQDLSVGDSTSRVSGKLIAITDIYRGLGFRGLHLSLGNLDLDDVRPFLDTLPFYGRLTGPLTADGFFDGMTVAFDWGFHDVAVPGGADSRVALRGNVRLGGVDGLFFGGALLHDSDVDLRTVRVVAPAVILDGRLGLDGTLTGPWKNVVYVGRVSHHDADRPTSRLSGSVRLDTRGEVLGLETDVVLDSLVFEGIRPSFPALTAKGALGGKVKLAGTLEHLNVDADVGGGLGHITALGRATLLPPRWGADSLRVAFDRLDLARVMRTAPSTRLGGTLLANGTATTGVAPTGSLDLVLAAGEIGGLAFDSAAARVRAADSLIRLDTLSLRWRDVAVGGHGAIGWKPSKTDSLSLHLEAPELAPFDSLALAWTGFTSDSSIGDVPLKGRGRADLVLSGALGALTLRATATIDSVRWLRYRGRNIVGRLGLVLADTTLDAGITADSLYLRSLAFGAVNLGARGQPDALNWNAAADGRNLVRFRAGGRLETIPAGQLLSADSVALDLQGRTWQLVQPFAARITPARIALDTIRFVTADGSGSIEMGGELPRQEPAALSVTALGVQIKDLYGVLQQDTTGIEGTVALDARLGGTAAMPTMRGSSTITGPVFGDFQAPLIRMAFDYGNRVLRSNLTFWRTGQPVVEVDATLPLDLALQRLAKRQVEGPLTLVARGDSVNLAIVEAFTPNLRRVSGTMQVDARVEGSWDAPRLAGMARVIAGNAEVPSLGVNYGPINGTFRLRGDSIVLDSVEVRGKTGVLNAGGAIRLEQLTLPVLDLDLSAQDFDLMDVPNYLRLRSWGDVHLSGSFSHPLLTGSGRLTNSVIYFADLVSKDIINLEDPLNADLVDTVALRKQDLRASFQSRFLDSLAIRDLDFIVGEGVWLRSLEANFQLEGRIRVSKTRKVYRIDGALDTPRGTYTLDVPGLINRTFTVDRGTVRYFGDLNAELDVEARHVVSTPQGSGGDIPVLAHISGTLEVPKLTLRTPPDRPPMTEQQIYSLLMFGTTDARVANFVPTQERFLAYSFNALSSELQRALLGAKGGTLEIRPGLASNGLIGGVSSSTQLMVGRAINSKLFVTANAGFCFSSGQSFSARNLGASLEYRFVRELRAVISAEPLQTCFGSGLATDALASTRRYQFGAELRWDRDY